MPKDGLVNFSADELHKATPAIRSYAFKLSNNQWDKEDLIQETLLQAIANQHLFHGGNLRSWLLTICHNLAMNRYRGTVLRKDLNVPIEVKQDLVIDKDNQSDINAIVTDMTMCLDRLSPEYKQILILNRIEQLDYTEIAQILQLPIGTVRSRLNRAKINLRVLLNQ